MKSRPTLDREKLEYSNEPEQSDSSEGRESGTSLMKDQNKSHEKPYCMEEMSYRESQVGDDKDDGNDGHDKDSCCACCREKISIYISSYGSNSRAAQNLVSAVAELNLLYVNEIKALQKKLKACEQLMDPNKFINISVQSAMLFIC